MTKLKGLLLTEGMHGMISQVEGLAKALDLDFIHEKIELNNFWKLFPPKLTPVSSNVYKKVESSDFDVIISCGRKSVIPSIHLKKNSNKRVINIHIQNPKVNFKNFDFIVAPEHDGITGENVINTKGAIHYLTKEEILTNKNYLDSFIKKDQRIGFFINQPQRVEDGSLNLRVPTSSDRDRTVTYSNLNVDLEPEARQINFDIIFKESISSSLILITKSKLNLN